MGIRDSDKAVYIVPHFFIVGMEDMCTIFMYMDALYIFTVDIASEMCIRDRYYPKGRDSHYLTDKAEVDRFIRERGDQYGGILGYVYP